MKTILCNGDSNTWGSDPGTGERFAEDVRWPGVLRKELGDDGDGIHLDAGEHDKLGRAVAVRTGEILG